MTSVSIILLISVSIVLLTSVSIVLLTSVSIILLTSVNIILLTSVSIRKRPNQEFLPNPNFCLTECLTFGSRTILRQHYIATALY